jgi:hypothetical protein
MSPQQLKELLDRVSDTGALVLPDRLEGDELTGELRFVWRAAAAEAQAAYDAWRMVRTAEAFAVYRAAADRADAAQAALARHAEVAA